MLQPKNLDIVLYLWCTDTKRMFTGFSEHSTIIQIVRLCMPSVLDINFDLLVVLVFQRLGRQTHLFNISLFNAESN